MLPAVFSRSRSGVVFVLVLILGNLQPPLRGELRSCHGLSSETPGLKILLDDVHLAGPPAPELNQIMAILQFRLETAMQEVALEPDLNIKVVRCPERHPTGGFADFAVDLLEVLDVKNVVLEVWGNVLPRASGCQAIVSFVLVPVRARDQRAELGFQQKLCESAATDLTISFSEIFEKPPELRAFAAVGAGVKRLQERKYDSARKLLCRAEMLLAEHRAADDPVLKHVADLNTTVLEAARNDPEYKGLLKELEVGGCRED